MRRLLAVLFVAGVSASTSAQWLWVSPARCARDADLVVVATLDRTTKSRAGGIDYEQGQLHVEESIAGSARKGDTLTLRWENPKDVICPRLDHAPLAGKRVLWFLTWTQDGFVRAPSPSHAIELTEPNVRWNFDHFISSGDLQHGRNADAVRAFFRRELDVADDGVRSAVVAAWGDDFRAAAMTRFPVFRIDVSLFSDRLAESRLTPTEAAVLTRNFIRTNETAKSTEWTAAPRLAIPAYDESRSHALIVGSSDAKTIRIAVLRRTADAWQVTWSGAMDAVAPPTGTPIPADLNPLRAGGDVVPPTLVQRVDPTWTPQAIAHGVSGTVVLDVIVDRDGRVRWADVVEPLPYGLDQAALDAVKQWQFRAGTQSGKPVDVIFRLNVRFRLTQ